MGTLRDKAYEELDYLSQLTEVVVSPHNEILARVPDRVELTFDLINRCKSRAWGHSNSYDISVYQVLLNQPIFADTRYIDDIKGQFAIQASDDFTVDFVNRTVTGTAALVKINHQMDEKVLLTLAVNKARSQLIYYSWPAKRLREKLITVMNLFEPNYGTEWIKSQQGRIAYAGELELGRLIETAILENKWRIRDAGIIAKVGEWINSYLSSDNDNDLGIVNLMKLKIMIDKDLPIYSIDEVKNVNNS